MKQVDPHSNPRGRSRLVLGLILLAMGALLLSLNLGVHWPWDLWKYFSIPLIALGLWGVISPSRHLERAGGIWLLTTGLFCLIGTFNLFGIGWGGAWPIFIIAAGVTLMLEKPRHRRDPETPEAAGEQRVNHE